MALPAHVASTVRAILGSNKCSKRVIGIGKKLLRQATMGQKTIEEAKEQGTWMEEAEAVAILHGVIDEEHQRLCREKQPAGVPTRAGGTVCRDVHMLCCGVGALVNSNSAACAQWRHASAL